MRSKRFSILIALIIVLSLAGSSISLVGAQDAKTLYTTLGPGDIPTLDPSLATDTSSHQIVSLTHIGLTVQSETAEVLPGMAESWTVADDGVTYTFSLYQNIPWVRYDADAGAVVEVTNENGEVRYVTAGDFEYSFKRMSDPELAADYAYITAEWIAGAGDFNAGEGTADDVQVSAIDDWTLEVVAADEAAFVPAILGLWFHAALPQWAIEEHGDFWIEPENYQSYGPYVVSEWNHEEDLTVVKNPFWPGTEGVQQAKIDVINFRMLDAPAALANYEAGEVDMVDTVPLSDIDRVKVQYPDEYFVAPRMCTYVYGFNVEKAPFDNAHMRRAFSHAIDRQSLIDNVLKGDQVAAQWFARPGLTAAPTLEDSPDLGIKSDNEAAQAELQAYLDEMGYASVDEMPPITLMHNESEAHAAIAEAIQQMWSENLGIDVQIATQEWAVYLDTLDEDAPQVFRYGWCMDYPDAHNFDSDVYRSTSGNNDTNYASEAYDALVDEAKTLTDTDARLELYRQAENLLVYEDAAIIPLYWYTFNQLTRTNVERTFSQDGTQRYYNWDIQ